LLTGFNHELKRQLTFLNVYGPCTDRRNFWQKIKERDLLSQENLIMAGDFNFTLAEGEIWGSSRTTDPLVPFLKSLFTEAGLLDIKPEILVPTWRNGRKGSDCIFKCLDRHFTSAELLGNMTRYRAWVAMPYLSDHAPILLQLEGDFQRKNFPFKLNPGLAKGG
jgi:endonuclease/exonuclease/phosphatase family metal-dependent hydrolase